MANLKEVRLRIVSVSSTQQITKAMKMVSAAKLRRAQNAIQQLRPYANKLRDILENLSSSLEGSEGSVYAQARPVEKVLIIAVTSNRGLAGAFNANIIRSVNRLLSEEYAAQNKAGNVKVLCIGKKASDFFSKNRNIYLGHHNEIFGHLDFEAASAIAAKAMTDFADGNGATILRSAEGNKQYSVRIKDLIKRGDVSANVEMKPGDILIIPRSWF